MGESVRETILRKIKESGWDLRTNRYKLEIYDRSEQKIIAKVDSEGFSERMRSLLAEACEEGCFEVIEMSDLLPVDYRFAMVVAPVTDMRSEAKWRSDRLHQLVFGEWVKVLEFDNAYALVKDMKTGYVGHVACNALDFCSSEERESIRCLSKFFISERFAYLSGMDTGFQGEKDLGWLPLGSQLFISRESEQGLYVVTPGKEYWIRKHDCFVAEEKPVTELDDWVDKYLRVPYLWGGCSTYGTDCSGFVLRLFDMLGTPLPRDTDQQKAALKEIEEQELEKGDLVFFPGHVGLYMGKGFIVHSNVTIGGVSFSQIRDPRDSYEHYLKESATGFRRVKKALSK